ncbi:MAG: hypothetical protein AAGG38_05525 [Planctomycetota bacterium]
MRDELTVPASLRDAAPAARLEYDELALRYFSDKSGPGQWPAKVNRKPGLVLRRSVDTDALLIDAVHRREQTVMHQTRLSLRCRRDPWRTPLEWESEQHLGDPRSPELPPTQEQARFEGGQLVRTLAAGSRGESSQTYRIRQPACLYAWWADFPLDASTTLDQADGWFGDNLTWTGSVRSEPGPPPGRMRHPDYCRGLTCHRLVPRLGLPLEFWVNAQGLVVYLLEGPTRAWVIRDQGDDA